MKEGDVTCEFMPKGDSSHKGKDTKDEIVTIDSIIYNNNSGYATVFLETKDKTMITFDVYTGKDGDIFFIKPGDKITLRNISIGKWNDDMARNKPIDEAENKVQSSKTEPISVKNDLKDDKLRWDLLPLEQIEEVVKVLHAGAKKYAPNTWQNLPDAYSRYKSAMFRHLMEAERGNIRDEETGCLHMAQVVTNALFMLYAKMKEYERSLG